MYFTRVELHNFGIYKGTHEMSLTDQIGERNITLVGGRNGRGKTTFHDAILLALYGKQAVRYIQEKAYSYEKLLLDHINKHATDDVTFVAVTLALNENEQYRVKRSWSVRNGKVETKVLVEKNGTEDSYLGGNWDYYIEEILPFGIARFFFFNNEKITQLADDTSFEQIKASIKSAIGVSTIERSIRHIDEVIRRKTKTIEAFSKSDDYVTYKDVEAQITTLDQRLAEGQQNLNDLELKRDHLVAVLEAQEKEFWSSGGDLSRNREAIKQEMQRIKDDVSQTNDQIMKLAVDPSTPLFMCRQLVQQSYDGEIDFQNREAKRYSENMILQKHKELIQRLADSGLDAETIATVKSIISDVLVGHLSVDAVSPLKKGMSSTSMMLYERLISEVFQTLAQHIENLIELVNSKENEWLGLDAHLGEGTEKTLAMQLYDKLKSLESEKALVEADIQRQKDSIDSMNRQREILVSKRIQLIKALADKENAHEDDARVVKYAAMSIEVLTEFKQRLQREKVSKLSAMATQCFHELVDKDSLVSQILIDPDTLDVTILDLDSRELLKNQLSAGEQQMFAISIVWALALSSGYKAPVIIDTPMARLDSAHRTNFVTKYLPAASSQVMVLSTDEEIYGRYLDLVRDKVVDYYTLLYREEEQCTSIVHGYFGEV